MRVIGNISVLQKSVASMTFRLSLYLNTDKYIYLLFWRTPKKTSYETSNGLLVVSSIPFSLPPSIDC